MSNPQRKDGHVYLLIADTTRESAAAAHWLGDVCRADILARVIVLYVFDPATYSGGPTDARAWQRPIDVAMEEDRRAAFDTVLSALALGPGRVRQVARVGHPVERIVHLAREERADAIVLGQAGSGATWRQVLHPTLAERLKRDAPCPVVTITMATAA